MNTAAEILAKHSITQAQWNNLNRQCGKPRPARGSYPFLSHRTIEQVDKDLKAMRGVM